MLAQVDSSAILGIDAYVVRVEVDISSSVPMAYRYFKSDRLAQVLRHCNKRPGGVTPTD